MNTEFVIVDVETTGVTPQLNEIIEIGAIRVNYSEGKFHLGDTFHTLIRPYHEIPHNIQNLTQINHEMVKDAPRFEEVADSFLKFLGAGVFVAHNVHFDVKMLNNSLERVSFPKIENEILDTQKIVAMAYPTLDSHKLGSIAKYLKLDTGSSHRALDDAKVTAQVFIKVMENLAELDLPVIMGIKRLIQSTHFPIKDYVEMLYRVKSERLSLDEKAQANHWGNVVHSFYRLKDLNHLDQEKEEMISLDSDGLEKMIQTGGELNREMKRFEDRPQQIEALQWIVKAFNDQEHLLLEAGTGTGKSLAYLIPAIYYAVQNQTCVVVSTRTKNLQDQLIEKDVPLLQSVLPFDFNALVIKGRENYLCIRKMERTVRDIEGEGSESEKFNAVPLLTWASQTEHGDLNELHSSTYKTFHNRIKSQAETCLNEKCAYFKRCFALSRKRESKKAHLIITNHALLFKDSASENNLLPAYQHVILDEGHAIFETAADAFSIDLTQGSVAEPLRRFPVELMDDVMVSNYERIRSNNIQFFSVLKDLVESEQSSVRGKQKIIDEGLKQHSLWKVLDLVKLDWFRSMEAYAHYASKKLEELDDEHQRNSIQQVLSALKQIKHQVETALQFQDNFISWIEMTTEKEPFRIHLNCAPIEVGSLIQQHLFATKKSVVITSATLRTSDGFDFFTRQLGLHDNPDLNVNQQVVGSPFEYEKQVLFCVPQDIAHVSEDKQYVQDMVQFFENLFEVCKGKTLILFTSYQMLQSVYSKLRVSLEKRGFHLLCQGKHGSRRAILNRFRECEKGILFGTDSFWEGVDIQDLSCVVIHKLPFAVPTDPLYMARMEKISALGGNAFMEMALPQAVMKFRQGMGRLIRSRHGHGAVIVLDRRLVEKNYGSAFFKAIPKCQTQIGSQQEVLQAVEAWLSSKPVVSVS